MSFIRLKKILTFFILGLFVFSLQSQSLSYKDIWKAFLAYHKLKQSMSGGTPQNTVGQQYYNPIQIPNPNFQLEQWYQLMGMFNDTAPLLFPGNQRDQLLASQRSSWEGGGFSNFMNTMNTQAFPAVSQLINMNYGGAGFSPYGTVPPYPTYVPLAQ